LIGGYHGSCGGENDPEHAALVKELRDPVEHLEKLVGLARERRG
jgi:hypothetical protein